MSRPGKYRFPKERKDEDIWFRWFTKEQLLYLAVATGLSVGCVFLFQLFRLTLIGFTVAVIIMFAGIIIPRAEMPKDKYLLGGGMPLKVIIARVLVKIFIDKKKIYISHIDNNIDD